MKEGQISRARRISDSRGTGFEIRAGLILALCAFTLACDDRNAVSPTLNEANEPSSGGAADDSVPEARSGEADSTAATVPSARAVDSREPLLAPLAGPEVPPARTVPLDDLVRLPESVVRSHGELADSDGRALDSESWTDEEREAARLRVEVRRQKESAEFDPDGSLTRERADAGVSVEVDEDARVRGGVRVERAPDEAWRDPVPTVGVEKRF